MLLAAVSAAGGSGIRVRDPEKYLQTNHTTREKKRSSATNGPKLSLVRDVAGDDVEPGLAERERERGREKKKKRSQREGGTHAASKRALPEKTWRSCGS